MTLIDGDKIITAQLYDDEHEEFTEKKMSIIEYVNAYTNEGVTEADVVLDKIRAEIEQLTSRYSISKERRGMGQVEWSDRLIKESNVLQIIDKYKAESEEA